MFLRYLDSVTVVYKVAVEDGKVTSVRLEVYHGEGSREEPDEQRWLVQRRQRLGDPGRLERWWTVFVSDQESKAYGESVRSSRTRNL